MTVRRLLVWIGLAAGVFVTSLVAGIIFGQSAPDVAARQIVREFIATEPVSLEALPEDTVAPTSGGNEGNARCGVLDVLSLDDEVATLDAGLAIVHLQSADDVTAAEAAMAAADPDAWALVVDERLADPVVITAWGVRMELDEPDEHLLPAFVTGYAGQRGPLPACS